MCERGRPRRPGNVRSCSSSRISSSAKGPFQVTKVAFHVSAKGDSQVSKKKPDKSLSRIVNKRHALWFSIRGVSDQVLRRGDLRLQKAPYKSVQKGLYQSRTSSSAKRALSVEDIFVCKRPLPSHKSGLPHQCERCLTCQYKRRLMIHYHVFTINSTLGDSVSAACPIMFFVKEIFVCKRPRTSQCKRGLISRGHLRLRNGL